MANANHSIQDILNTLSTFTQPQTSLNPGFPPSTPISHAHTYVQTQPQYPRPPPASNHVEPDFDVEDEYDPTTFDPASFSTAATALPDSRPSSSTTSTPNPISTPLPSTHPVSQTRNQAKSPRTNDPSDPRIITSWSTAMIYVRTHLLSSPANIHTLRKLISNQALNERQWWTGREALLRQQRERGDRRKEINDVLRAVGGKVKETKMPFLHDKLEIGEEKLQDEEREELRAELMRFDLKVHKAVGRMVEEGTREMRGLGVPFFCIKEELVRDAEGREGGERDEETISKGTLEKLQRRMLDYLQVSCQE